MAPHRAPQRSIVVRLAAVTRLRTAVMASMALPFAGCTLVGPDFVTPPAPVADSFLGVKGAPEPWTREETRRWWTVFDDPTLDQLIERASNQNLTLASAGTRVLEARADLGVAIGGLYPQQQEAVGDLRYSRFSKFDAFSAANPTGSFWRASFGAQLAWELDFWGKFRRAVESADDAYLASIATYDQVLVTLLGDVATTYIGIRTVENQIELARANIVRQRRALAIAEDRFKNGTATRLDIYQAQNVLGATEARVPQLMIQLQQGKNALCVLLGIVPQPLDEMLARSTGIPAPPDEVALGVPADLLRRRPDIRAAELHAAAQSAQIGVAQAELYPSFTLIGNVGLASSDVAHADLSDIFAAKALAYSFGPSVQWKFLNYGRITNNVRAQDARTQALLVDYQNAVLKAQQDVDDGMAAFVLSREQAKFLRRSATAARGALELSFTQYHEGLRDFTTVLTAEQNLLDAENNLAVSTGAVASALVGIYRALGGGWEIRDGKDFIPAATRDEMRNRTDWGPLLPPGGNPQPATAAGPAPAEKGPIPRSPDW